MRAQSSDTTGLRVVTPPNGNPFVALPKPCWPEHSLTGRDTLWHYVPCRSLDVYPPGMRIQVECVLDRVRKGGWGEPLIAETWRSPPLQWYHWEKGRTRPGQIVTNVSDARTGFHYWGLAIDIVHGKRGWAYPRFFEWLARYYEACGLVAGGYWKKLKDWPHGQFAAWESMSRAPVWARRLMAEGKRDSLWKMAGAMP